jgi:hypothetical protein
MGSRHATSIRNVRRIIGDPVAFEDVPVFAAEAMLPMVMFLVSDVIADLRVGVWCYAECSVAVLPPKISPMWKGVVNPSRGCGLDAVDQFRQRQGTGRLEVEVDVISYASGTQQLTAAARDDR